MKEALGGRNEDSFNRSTGPTRPIREDIPIDWALAEAERNFFLTFQNMLVSERLPRSWRSPWTSWVAELRFGPALSEALHALGRCKGVSGSVKADDTSRTGMSVELNVPEEVALWFHKGDPVALQAPGGERIPGRVITSMTGQPIVVAVRGAGLSPGTELSMVTS